LLEETNITLTVKDYTQLNGDALRVPLAVGKCHLVHVYSTFIHVPHVNVKLRTCEKVKQADIEQVVIEYACRLFLRRSGNDFE
jgi:hypothetical protein